MFSYVYVILKKKVTEYFYTLATCDGCPWLSYLPQLQCNKPYFVHRYTSCSYRPKMKQQTEEARVDVRMIDFAHTTFVHGSTVACNSNSTVHQGPDCGFLTGLDSLRRLLLEILTEG